MTEPATPERPQAAVTPFLTIRGGRANEALEFYGKAFGGEVFERRAALDGRRLLQASVKVNGGWIMVSDEFPELMNGRTTPPPAGVCLHLQVDDADVWWARALAAGAEVAMPIADQFWGDRYGQLSDPFGHLWAIGSPSDPADY